jgi:hypothetical protein
MKTECICVPERNFAKRSREHLDWYLTLRCACAYFTQAIALKFVASNLASDHAQLVALLNLASDHAQFVGPNLAAIALKSLLQISRAMMLNSSLQFLRAITLISSLFINFIEKGTTSILKSNCRILVS